jgi:hypothetical protein
LALVKICAIAGPAWQYGAGGATFKGFFETFAGFIHPPIQPLNSKVGAGQFLLYK